MIRENIKPYKMAFSYIFTLPISRYAYHVWPFTGFCLNRAKGYKPIPKLFAFMAQSLSLGKHLDYIQGIVQGLFIVQSKQDTSWYETKFSKANTSVRHCDPSYYLSCITNVINYIDDAYANDMYHKFTLNTILFWLQSIT